MSNANQTPNSPYVLPNLSRSARWVLTAVLITNIGNGMNTLVVGKLLYDKTGSVVAFGGVLIAESIITFLLQFLAGSIVDRGNPKWVCVWGDLLRGLFVIVASLMLVTPQGYWWIFASVVVIELAKPFYRSATFALGPAIAPGEELAKYNALSMSFLQAGQLIGVGLLGPVIQHFGAEIAFALNGVSFVLSGLVVALVQIPRMESNTGHHAELWFARLINDWKEIGRLLQSDRTFIWHIALCAGDFLAISFINLALVPLVDQRFGGNAYWLSAFDGAFAVGSLIASFKLVDRLVKAASLRNISAVGIGTQAVLLSVLAFLWNPYLAILVMLLMGVANTLSLTVFMSKLQLRSRGPVKGRIAGVRSFVLSLLSGLFVPLVANVQTMSLGWELLTSGLICGAFCVTTFILTRQWAFGERLFGQESKVPYPTASAL